MGKQVILEFLFSTVESVKVSERLKPFDNFFKEKYATLRWPNIKQLLDEDEGYQPKTESSNCFIIIIHWTKENWSHVFPSSLTASNTKRANLTWLPFEIMHRGHTSHDYPWPWASLTWSLYNLQLWRRARWFRRLTVRFRPIRKELESSMYNNCFYLQFSFTSDSGVEQEARKSSLKILPAKERK